MNLTKLKNNQIQLIEHIEKGGYSQDYVNKIKNEIKKLLDNEEKFDDYIDYYNYYIKTNNFSKHVKLDKLSMLTVIMNFDLYDNFPNRTNCKHKLIDNSNYSKLNSYYKDIIDNYKVHARNKANKEQTINAKTCCCTIFFLYLQNINHNNLKNIEEKEIINFFLDNNGNAKYSSSFVRKIKFLLKEMSIYSTDIKNIVEFIPNVKNFRKNIDYLADEEIYKIKETLNNKNNKICLRDKAIVTLLLYLGLRSCDIVNLKLSNIDWNKEIINIIQSKTGVPLQLPLTNSVGNALYEYIVKERPNINLDNVFIRMDINYPITKASTEFAVENVFKEANIRQDNKKRKGTHIFRYNLATTLLKNETPQPIISQVLGHTTSESLDYYLYADFYHLKQCALDIEQFVNIKEVM